MFLELHETHDGEDMFEPSYVNLSLDSIRDDVSSVRRQFNDCLAEDDMGREELEYLALMLDRANSGEDESYQSMAEEGAKLLEKVQSKLKTAAEDLQRFDGESAATANTTGQRADRLTKAATALRQAQERLSEIAQA